MKCSRRTAMLLVWLVAGGFILNVAAAWGFAVTVDRWPGRAMHLGRSVDHVLYGVWNVNTVKKFGSTEVLSQAFRHGFSEQDTSSLLSSGQQSEAAMPAHEALPWWCSALQPARPMTRPEWMSMTALAHGWPMRSMIVIKDHIATEARWIEPIKFDHVPAWIRGRHRGMAPTWPVELPQQLLWTGAVINTIFYAAILWLLYLAPAKVRRTLRRRRGLCPACAYPMGTGPVCTECGGALPSPSR